jgi:thiamine biosynthesis lipoprotein
VTTPLAVTAARQVHVEHCMGTVFTFDVRDPGDWRDAIGAVVAELHRIDALFSTYRPDSDISRLRRGELGVDDADPDVARVLDLCIRMHVETDGYFSALTPTGVDPTGLVKGWAIERASGILRAHGSDNHAVNGGGDLQLAGEAAPGRPWRVGVSDPHDRTRLLATLQCTEAAVAGSGTAERGEHLVDPFTGRPPQGLAAVTVVGPSLTRADAYATGAFARGADAVRWLNGVAGHEALVVDAAGSVRVTRGLHRHLAAPAR